ncbi:25 kDa calcium-binding protein (macronuclear) [Tetrahymena thermophila SB210]|nr:25 kDa calcium-binding protein [Tetrahymena thermophila SB210]EAR87509.3 25 kDa calcium-binding protein [Tetrahymena thermophila SB210]|eukprot:XP_001007754.3 25 kDa calcium-binding protein [Tetrahymena thermophila SB210]
MKQINKNFKQICVIALIIQFNKLRIIFFLLLVYFQVSHSERFKQKLKQKIIYNLQSKKKLIKQNSKNNKQTINKQMAQYSQTLRSSGFTSTVGLTDIEGAKTVARRIFENYDKGRKGRIENTDCVPMITEAYKSFNSFFAPSSDDIKAYHRVLDRNGDGIVTYQDIEELCIRYLTGTTVQRTIVTEEKVKKSSKPKYNPEVEAKLDVARRLFKRYDKDGSGQLQDDEIAGLLKDTYAEMGMSNFTPTKEDVKIWLQMADTNSDGSVSLEEYEDLIIKSLQKAGIRVEKQSLVF